MRASNGSLERTRPVGLGLTAAGVSLIAVSYGLARFAYGLFVPVFRAAFDLDSATAGAIAAGSYVAYCVAIVVASILTPRHGARSVAVGAGCIATVGTLLIATAPTATMLAVGVVVAGSSTGVASPPLAHAVAHTVAVARRDRTQTVINAGTGVGVAAAGPIALVTVGHWRAAWVAFAIVCALVTVWVARTVPPGAVHRSGQGSARGLLPTPLRPAGSGRLVGAAALLGAGSSAVWTFGRDLLTTVGGMGEVASTTAWILLGAVGVLGAAAGDLARRVGLGAAWWASTSVLAASTGLLAVFAGSHGAAWLAAAAFGAAYMASTGLLLLWGMEVYAPTPAAGVGVAFLTLALGQAAGAPLVGILADATDLRTAFTVAALVAVLGACIRPAPPQERPQTAAASRSSKKRRSTSASSMAVSRRTAER